MAFDPLDLILQFTIRVAAVMIITVLAIKAARRLARPVGTYGAGLPERRMRPRLVFTVPPVAPQSKEVASNAA